MHLRVNIKIYNNVSLILLVGYWQKMLNNIDITVPIITNAKRQQ